MSINYYALCVYVIHGYSACKTPHDYWLRSKEVTTFEGIRDLHVLEKLHDTGTLHPVVLRHVLTVEADQNHHHHQHENF